MSDLAARYGRVLDSIGEWDERGGMALFRCCFPARHRNGDANPSGRAKIGHHGQLLLRCFGCGAVASDFAKHLGLSVADFFADSRTREGRRAMDLPQRVTATYDYCNEQGVLYARKLRLEPGWHGRKKDFIWQRPIAEELTKARGLPAGWAQGMSEGRYTPGKIVDKVQIYVPVDPAEENPPYVPLPMVRPGLYRLPDLIAAPPTVPVFLVEGEGKADLLNQIGMVATCAPHGANAWDHGYSQLFAGRRVVIVSDDDTPGWSFSRTIAGSLAWVGVQELRLLQRSDRTQGWPEAGDVKDWLLTLPVAERKAALVTACKLCQQYSFSQAVAA